MKRSSCLSAMLVGLSIVTASVAFAAPPAEGTTGTEGAKAKGQAPTTVQPSDPTPSGGGSDPTAAPATPAPSEDPAAAPTETPPAAAVTITAPPGADTPATAPEEPTVKAKPRPWAGTYVINYNSMSTVGS
jgi:hypothetical protein